MCRYVRVVGLGLVPVSGDGGPCGSTEDVGHVGGSGGVGVAKEHRGGVRSEHPNSVSFVSVPVSDHEPVSGDPKKQGPIGGATALGPRGVELVRSVNPLVGR